MTERQYTARSRPFGRDRSPRLVLVGLALFVVVALVKPWPGASTRQGPSGSPNTALATASPSTGPSESVSPIPTPGPNAMACLSGDVEQVVTLERTDSGRVQTWIASIDEEAPDPVALHLAPIPVFSIHVVGVGVCGPDRGSSSAPSAGRAGGRGPAATVIDVRMLGARGGSGLVDLGAPLPLDGQSGGVDDALLFGAPQAIAVVPPAPASSAPAPASSAPSSAPSSARGRASPSATASASVDPGYWAAGSYSIGFTFASDQPGTIRWVRVEFAPGVGATG